LFSCEDLMGSSWNWNRCLKILLSRPSLLNVNLRRRRRRGGGGGGGGGRGGGNVLGLEDGVLNGDWFCWWILFMLPEDEGEGRGGLSFWSEEHIEIMNLIRNN